MKFNNAKSYCSKCNQYYYTGTNHCCGDECLNFYSGTSLCCLTCKRKFIPSNMSYKNTCDNCMRRYREKGGFLWQDDF